MAQTPTTKPDTDIYWLDTGESRIYFNVTDGIVTARDRRTAVPCDKFITFLQTANELGLKTGKI